MKLENLSKKLYQDQVQSKYDKLSELDLIEEMKLDYKIQSALDLRVKQALNFPLRVVCENVKAREFIEQNL